MTVAIKIGPTWYDGCDRLPQLRRLAGDDHAATRMT